MSKRENLLADRSEIFVLYESVRQQVHPLASETTCSPSPTCWPMGGPAGQQPYPVSQPVDLLANTL